MPKLKDYTGQKFGRLECLSFATRINGITYWRCKCDCGRQVDISVYNLVSGNTKSCGCLKQETARANVKPTDHTGQKFGRLECLCLSEQKKSEIGTYWKCQCDCGKIVDVKTNYLVTGNIKSCGCLRREKAPSNIKIEDYTGQKFGHLECMHFIAKSKQEDVWKCKCDCGAKINVRISNVISGIIKSCGCLK